MNCIACGTTVNGTAWIGPCTFHSPKPHSRLNGVTFEVHSSCFRLRFPELEAMLPDRISDPEAEPDTVTVDQDDHGWSAFCRECDRLVAIKAERDDAEMAAAVHLARKHVGAVA